MKRLMGILGLFVFMIIVIVLAGNWIEKRKVAMESRCTETRAALGLCK